MILVTGAAGFIGFHLTMALLSKGDKVVGIDNLNDYYDPQLKIDRLEVISSHPRAECFTFIQLDIGDRAAIESLFGDYNFEVVVNLAAQAGVRYSLDQPHAYTDSNVTGFLNILEGCRYSKVKHLVFASSSSVYGMNVAQPFSTDDRVDFPISLYAATKKSNELMAHAYSHLFDIAITGLRFFTVYGPYGRPDMAYFKFAEALFDGKPIDVYNNGEMERDFTYIDDIVQGITEVITLVPKREANQTSLANPPYKIYNIGNNNPVSLGDFIKALEDSFGKIAKKNLLPMQPGDVPSTFANIDPLIQDVGFKPETDIRDGLQKFTKWYLTWRARSSNEALSP